MHNVADYIKIAVVAFAGVFIINRVLSKTGLDQYTTH